MKGLRRLPWTILFIIFSVWALLIEWPTWAWSAGAAAAADTAVTNEQAAFQTIQMDNTINERETSVVAQLHRLPNLLLQRGRELNSVDRLMNDYSLKEDEKKLDGDGTFHLSWSGSQGATLHALYDFDALPLPVNVTRLSVVAASDGVHVQVDGKAIGANQ